MALTSAIEIDPNQLAIAVSAVVVSILSLLGVSLTNSRRLKGVVHEITPNGGGNLHAEVVAIAQRTERLERESAERWETIAGVQQSVNKVHSTQLSVMRSAEPLVAELARLAQAQQTMDLRMSQVEVNTNKQLAEMRAAIGLMQRGLVDHLQRQAPLTPPHGIPVTTTKKEKP